MESLKSWRKERGVVLQGGDLARLADAHTRGQVIMAGLRGQCVCVCAETRCCYSVMRQPVSSLPGLSRHPLGGGGALKSPSLWLRGRREQSQAEGGERVSRLWRVHDKWYDLEEWVDSHPGGREWLVATRGTDITEAFESHHISPRADALLPRYYREDARHPRTSPYTFLAGGFYRTLKGRAGAALASLGGVRGRAMRRASALTADLLLAACLVSACAAAAAAARGHPLTHPLCAVPLCVSAVALAACVVSAHNFLHQRDGIRMWYFDLSMMSSREWRVSHALSHHLFPNTVLDLEISMFEPLLQYLPDPGKSWFARYGPWLYSPLVYVMLFPYSYINRMAGYALGVEAGPRLGDALPLVVPTIMLACGAPLGAVLSMWATVIGGASFTFSLVGLNAAHHHPDIFHDGDTPRADMDWGVQQLDAVRDRPVVSASRVLTLTTFGQHALHHLFPTVDHALLPVLVPVLEQTLADFGLHFESRGVLELAAGQLRQCARREPNREPPGGRPGKVAEDE